MRLRIALAILVMGGFFWMLRDIQSHHPTMMAEARTGTVIQSFAPAVKVGTDTKTEQNWTREQLYFATVRLDNGGESTFQTIEELKPGTKVRTYVVDDKRNHGEALYLAAPTRR